MPRAARALWAARCARRRRSQGRLRAAPPPRNFAAESPTSAETVTSRRGVSDPLRRGALCVESPRLGVSRARARLGALRRAERQRARAKTEGGGGSLRPWKKPSKMPSRRRRAGLGSARAVAARLPRVERWFNLVSSADGEGWGLSYIRDGSEGFQLIRFFFSWCLCALDAWTRTVFHSALEE